MTSKCVNCGGDHDSFNQNCKVLIRHKIINTVMAYANVSRIKSINLIRSKNIISVDQVANIFKSQAFRGWNAKVLDLDLMSVGRQDKPYNKVRGARSFRKSDPASAYGLSLPLVSSSRYLSCIDSQSLSNTNSVTSPQDPRLCDVGINNEVLGAGEATSTKSTPLLERIPSVGENIAGRNVDPINGYLSEVFFIMQQQNKPWQLKLREVMEMSQGLANPVV